jgi:glucose/arabinose dehydrogenase
VLVAESNAGRISLFHDTNGDGMPDVQEVFLDGLNKPFGMALSGKSFYVGNTDSVMIYPYTTGDSKIDQPGQKIVDLPGSGYNNHWTRNLLIDPTTHKLYITVGSGAMQPRW